jgi:hypothetical protein
VAHTTKLIWINAILSESATLSCPLSARAAARQQAFRSRLDHLYVKTDMKLTDTMCTDAQTENPAAALLSRIAQYVDSITMKWKRAADDISAVASLCAGANKEFPPAVKKELFLKLPFHRTVFSKLAQIGADPRIHCPDVENRLPANYSFQYELTKFSTQELDAALADDNVVNPRATRAALLGWVKDRRVAEKQMRTEIKGLESRSAAENYDGELEKREDEDKLLGVLKRLWGEATLLKKKWQRVPRGVRGRFVAEVLKWTPDLRPGG